MKSRAEEILEEFASSYSELDVERLARLLEEIASRQVIGTMALLNAVIDETCRTVKRRRRRAYD